MRSSLFFEIFPPKKVIIGVIHFPPLLGYPKSPGLAIALKNALQDLKTLERGGVDGIIFENNYDIPHKPLVDPQIITAMTFLGEKIRQATTLPLGASVLWNDYKAALSIAKVLGLQFIRIPVFVDKVKTGCGVIVGQPKKVVNFRKFIKAENIALFTDIQVKHSKLLSKHNLATSARLAVKNGSDAVIITGKWTGQAPAMVELKSVRESIGKFPILVGSGTDEENIEDLLKYANGAIVGTFLKKGGSKPGEINVKTWKQRIGKEKVEAMIKKVEKVAQY